MLFDKLFDPPIACLHLISRDNARVTETSSVMGLGSATAGRVLLELGILLDNFPPFLPDSRSRSEGNQEHWKALRPDQHLFGAREVHSTKAGIWVHRCRLPSGCVLTSSRLGKGTFAVASSLCKTAHRKARLANNVRPPAAACVSLRLPEAQIGGTQSEDWRREEGPSTTADCGPLESPVRDGSLRVAVTTGRLCRLPRLRMENVQLWVNRVAPVLQVCSPEDVQGR